MTETEMSAKDRVVLTAAQLFRRKGFHGVGLSELLVAAQVPKGSLYHHFPNGKSDVALAAADLASREMVRIINDAFAEVETISDGITTLCFKLAKLFDLFDHQDGCPVWSILFDTPDNMIFRDKAREIFDHWIETLAAHARRLNATAEEATETAEMTLMTLEGAWILARARESSDPLRKLPQLLFRAGS